MSNRAKIGYREVVDLRQSFPVSWRYAFRKTIGFAAVLGALVGGYWLLDRYHILPNSRLRAVQNFRYLILWGMVGAIAVKYIMAEAYRQCFYYGTEGFRLVISRGVMLKQRGSLPLLPVSEIYVQRNLLDMLLGLANVDVYTPMDQTRKFARVECLRTADANHLQDFLGKTLTTQVFLNPAAEDEESLAESRLHHYEHEVEHDALTL